MGRISMKGDKRLESHRRSFCAALTICITHELHPSRLSEGTRNFRRFDQSRNRYVQARRNDCPHHLHIARGVCVSQTATEWRKALGEQAKALGVVRRRLCRSSHRDHLEFLLRRNQEDERRPPENLRWLGSLRRCAKKHGGGREGRCGQTQRRCTRHELTGG